MAAEEHHHHHEGGGDGNAGVYAILIIIVILILGAVLYFAGVFGPGTADDEADLEADIRIEQPEAPDIEVDVPEIEVPDTITIID